MSKLKKLTIFLLVFVIMLVSIPFETINAVTNNPYLVLIETNKGQWTAYKEMVSLSLKGIAMIKASEFCDAIGFEYSSNSKTRQFSVKKSQYCYNSYKLNNTAYTNYTAKNKYTVKKAQEPAYYDKTIKINLCDSGSMATLSNSKIFPLANTSLRNSGYSYAVCYSTYGIIKVLPDINKLKYDDGIPLRDMGPIYKSPDGKWSTHMFYMDVIVNGERKLLPTMATFDYDTIDSDSATRIKRITIAMDPRRYNPKNSSEIGKDDMAVTGNGPYMYLTINPEAKQGVTYSKNDFGLTFSNGEKVKGTYGIFNLRASPCDGHDNSAISFLDFVNTFSDVTFRLDTLDYEKGIVTGYIKFKTTNVGHSVEIEGYFAENFKDDKARPTISQIFNQLHPNGISGSTNSTVTQQGTSINSNPTIKVPTSKFVTCQVCRGTGRIPCSSCNGVGYTEHMGYQYGQYGTVVDVCRICGGTGSRTCTTCGGTGLVLTTSN